MKTLKILVIDNESRWVNFLEQQFQVMSVPDIASALAQLRLKPFDLIMVSSRQLTALESIRQSHPEIPIIVMTVQATSQEARAAYLKGARRYMTKTFDVQALYRQIEDVVLAEPNLIN
ncbi:MAG: response regulator [Anaerolineales bacterium]|nr:response regulator [Anaerolineales bacterium]